jgi:streptogramin lyase
MKIFQPVKTVVEYPLPAAGQTHEILAVSDKLLLISQQTDGSLVKVALDTNGRPTGARKWVVTNPWSGLHGLTLQSTSCGLIVWATVQFDNAILQIDPNGDDINAKPQVKRTIPIPSPASGPHRVLENNGNLWITCKSSSHVVRISINEQDDHQIWAVSERPIFIAIHPTSRDVFSGLDLSSKIWHYKNDGKSGQEIAIPPERGTTPVGLVAGPDDNVWVALLGNSTTGTGTFGRINEDASIDWFTMSSAIGSTASLIHMAFDQEQTGRLWMLGSSMACASSVNAIFTVDIDDISTGGTAKPRIARQNSIALPTQRSAAHRVISHKGGLYVTELATSTLAHISGAAVDGLDDSETWDQFADYGLGSKAVYSSYDNAV